MYRYYVYDKTRKSWRFVELPEEFTIGEIVHVNYGSDEKTAISECEIIKVMRTNIGIISQK